MAEKCNPEEKVCNYDSVCYNAGMNFTALNNLIAKYPLAWQFFKFCMVGFTNLGIYLLVYLIMTRLLFWHYIPASIVSFIVAVTWSYYINSRYTFKHDGSNAQKTYLTFITANLISMGVNLILLTLFIEVFKIYDIVAQLISSFFVAFFNFGLNRFWTFRK